VNAEMLSPGEREWLNAYHADVSEKLMSRVSLPAKDWLRTATRPI
jgi:Xaa-Pro aminopeptidase